MQRKLFPARIAAQVVAAVILSVAVNVVHAAGGNKSLSFTLTDDEHGKVLQTPDGRTVFRYMTQKPAVTELTANSVCCFYPVKTPLGEDVVAFASSDHRHHRGVFLAWHSTEAGKRADFWGWGAHAPTEDRVIQNQSVKLVEADAKHAVVEVRNDWIIEKDVVMKETLTALTCEQKGVYVIDLNYQFAATNQVTLNHTAFGGFCIKGRKDGKAVYTSPDGEVKGAPAPHHAKPELNWPAADWYDYTIKLDSGKTVGIAVLDHPDNPPTTWHNLGQIHMVNPCIVAAGPIIIKQGDPLTLRYRLVVHDGPASVPALKRQFAEWQ